MATTKVARRRVTMECSDCEHQYEDHLTRADVAQMKANPFESISNESRCPRCAQCESVLIRIHTR